MLSWLWKLLGFSSHTVQPSPSRDQGPSEQTASQNSASPVSAGKSRTATKQRPKPLPQLRHQPTTPETSPVNELSPDDQVPYSFSNLDVMSGRYLDLSQDGNPEQLEELKLPVLKTPADLANWLGISIGRLAWLVDRLEDYRRPQSVNTAHYHFYWQPKSSGEFRLIESPKPFLKAVQWQLLDGILNQVPAHHAAHGFVAGRSALTNAEGHVGCTTVLNMDLDNFYGRIRFSRIVALFRTIGYTREVAIWLGKLTTSAAPSDLNAPAGASNEVRNWTRRHLPQGAPTSPALANLVAYSLDVRLTGLASKFGASYTRYADDLTFSGNRDFRRSLKLFIPLIRQILKNERYLERRTKRKVLTQSMRQTVTGVVVNEKVNVSRKDFDTLKAILTNCILHGPASQNREQHPEFRQHLLGRIAHIRQLNPNRGAKLTSLFSRIKWN